MTMALTQESNPTDMIALKKFPPRSPKSAPADALANRHDALHRLQRQRENERHVQEQVQGRTVRVPVTSEAGIVRSGVFISPDT